MLSSGGAAVLQKLLSINFNVNAAFQRSLRTQYQSSCRSIYTPKPTALESSTLQPTASPTQYQQRIAKQPSDPNQGSAILTTFSLNHHQHSLTSRPTPNPTQCQPQKKSPPPQNLAKYPSKPPHQKASRSPVRNSPQTSKPNTPHS